MSTQAPPRAHARSAAARRQFRRSLVILAAAAWTAFVWFGRLSIVLDGSNAAPFRIVHGVLLVVSLGFAAALTVVGIRMLIEARRGEADGA